MKPKEPLCDTLPEFITRDAIYMEACFVRRVV